MVDWGSRVVALKQRYSSLDRKGDLNMNTRAWAVMVWGVAVWLALGGSVALWAMPVQGGPPTRLSCAEIKAIAKPLLEPAAYAELSQLSTRECESGATYLTPGELAYLFRFGKYEPNWNAMLHELYAGGSSFSEDRIVGRDHARPTGSHMHIYVHTHGNNTGPDEGLIIGVGGTARLLLMIIGAIALLSLPILTLIGLLCYRRFIMT